jgi:hypothetical protein
MTPEVPRSPAGLPQALHPLHFVRPHRFPIAAAVTRTRATRRVVREEAFPTAFRQRELSWWVVATLFPIASFECENHITMVMKPCLVILALASGSAWVLPRSSGQSREIDLCHAGLDLSERPATPGSRGLAFLPTHPPQTLT